ncbi:ADP-ribosyl-[dinitrogen reductase] glycohydrolase [hydrothermal vent metagenome]|uniref:ADP-ribosyl-[dinitrogen reductase] glycohydrolase n=1 Tax=hydrothermal vent metagenome TaxID=652676 RepID=A0A3B1BDL0_9ZZZZ
MSSSRDQSANDRAKAAYLGLAIGDALGVTVEFMTPNEIQHLHGVHKNIVGGGWLKLKSGMVTDDTQMSLALGSALLSCAQVDARVIAESFSEWMRSKPVDIGNTVRRGLIHYRTHGETSSPKSEYSAGNGACMRCLPIALASLGHDKETVRLASRTQAHITHHADLSDAGTEHIIELVQMAIRNHSLTELEACSQIFVRDNPEYRFDNKKISNPSGFIVETLQVVLQSFYSTHDFESCLIEVVNRGGDADTTGAIAGMLAGAYYDLDSLPQRWRDKLDQGVGELCAIQADKLMALAPIDVAGMGVL